MKPTKKIETEVLKVYSIWLHSYLHGDVETYNKYLDKDYHFIGSTDNEEFLSKKDTTDFFRETADQLAGKCDLRNENKIIEQFGELVFITHLFDAWFKNGDDFAYYGRFRFTNALKENKVGWRFIYQHFSTTDSKTDEGETIGFDKVNLENQELREAIKRRTFELEQKNRELEVETALEKVRSRTMAMHKSEELQEVIHTVHKELLNLNISINGGSFITINSDIQDEIRCWGSGGTADTSEEIVIPRYKKPFCSNLIKGIKKGPGFFTEEFTSEEKKDFFTHLFQHQPWSKLSKEEKSETLSSPGGYTRSCCVSKNTSIFIINHFGRTFSNTENDILKRFAKVFEQTYTRFLDLQKAEAQAREAQIEAALEKVRSRSLAMQKPEKLQEVVAVVAEKLKELGVIFDAGGVILCTYFPDNKDVMHWIAAPDFSYSGNYLVPYFDNPIFNDAWDSKLRGDAFFSKEFPVEAKNDFFEYAFEHSDYKDFPEEFKQHALQAEQHRLSAAWSKNSAILIPSFTDAVLSEDDAEIMKRFAKVFEQAYIRFLDLQKVEEQAKEAKIEASLEKVRSVALTLKKSDDMLDIAQVLYEQLLALGFSDIRNAIIDIHNDDNETFIDYDYSHDMSSAVTEFSFYGDPVIEQQVKKVQSSNDAFFEIDLKGEDLKKLIDTRLENGEKDDPRLHKTEHLTYNLYSFGNGAIGISNFGILSEEQKKVLKRFRNVFTFAYKRYTDLANAEAQALEAKIEAALEKVRSAALGLNTSKDMLEVAKALYEQLLGLGFVNIRNSIIDIDNEDGETFLDYDYSHEMGGTLTQMSYNDDPTLKEQLKDIIATTDGFSEMVLKGQQLQDLIEMRRKNGEADDLRLMDTDSVSYILYAFGKGAIGISNFGKLPEHQKTILSRFRNVFTLAYQRYTDLAQSEAQAAALLAEKQRLEVALSDLQETQKQLIQSEKMASLGELTAGIAHEIQNPLNFVNNFSEVSNELIEEIDEELANGDMEEVKLLLKDIKQNLEKINHHGKRADGIVKGMLQHSRKSTATKEPTDINKLADEYLRLAYHGLRAKNKSFNATLKTDFDKNIGLVNIIPQDMGRVILNLITNAFYASPLPPKGGFKDPGYVHKPTVWLSSKKTKDSIMISVRDNGPGIPKEILDKIFQPFFTTKPTGEGTGLGLSMSYDIVTKGHDGKLKVETEEGKGTTFIITIPKQ